MLTEKRHALILDAIEKKGAVSVTELVEKLGTSESTIRRDLAFLDRNKSLKKVHGGALKLETQMILTEPNVSDKKKLFSDEKDKIAMYAAQTIRSNDLVFIDAGTTTEKMIGYLEEKSAAFVTNGLNHARLLAKKGFRYI